MSIYRDDLSAQRHRLSNIEHERAGLQQHRRRLQMVVSQKRDLDASVDEARRRVLDDLHIASPCPASWHDMAGDGRARFCEKCAKNVYNVAAMTRSEAENFIQSQEGEVCLRLHKRSDGTVITADCPVGARRKRRRRVVVGALAAASACVAGALATTVTSGAMVREPTRVTTPESMLAEAGAEPLGGPVPPREGATTVVGGVYARPAPRSVPPGGAGMPRQKAKTDAQAR